ncbi:MAG: zinc-binding dehydrogenase [Nitrososphaera sp.]
MTGRGVDVVVDCIDAENTTRHAFRILNKGGTIIVVGFFENEVKTPLFRPFLANFKSTFHSGKITMSYAKS